MNGIEFLREVRNDPALRSTTVVVLTTSKDEQDRIDAYNLNVAGYLVKPVTFTPTDFEFSSLMMMRPIGLPFGVACITPACQSRSTKLGPRLRRLS